MQNKEAYTSLKKSFRDLICESGSCLPACYHQNISENELFVSSATDNVTGFLVNILDRSQRSSVKNQHHIVVSDKLDVIEGRLVA